MNLEPTTIQTFASSITVCGRCGVPIQSSTLNHDGSLAFVPCGHTAVFVIKPNPTVAA